MLIRFWKNRANKKAPDLFDQVLPRGRTHTDWTGRSCLCVPQKRGDVTDCRLVRTHNIGVSSLSISGRLRFVAAFAHSRFRGVLRALYTGRSSDSGIRHSCFSSQEPLLMTSKQRLLQHSNGLVRDSHPFPFSPEHSLRHLYTNSVF